MKELQSPFSFLRRARLALASLLLPSGFAIWSWGLDDIDGDVLMCAKEPRDDV